jgi:hypothetical protein
MVDNPRAGTTGGEPDSSGSENTGSDSTDSDDAALRWDGEADTSYTDTSYVDGSTAAGRARVKGDPRASAKTAARESRAKVLSATAAAADDSPPAKPEISSFLLVTYGILAGMYGLYVIGWIVAINRTAIVLSDPLGQLMFQFGHALAIGSAPLWFAAVFLLTRKNKAITRLLWLLLGLLLVAPWPAILGGA